MVKLSKRLSMVASLVTPGNSVADVGCDHAYTSIYLLQSGISPRAIAMDLRKGPLEIAKNNIAETGLGNRIETRLSNGLARLEPGEVDTILISGMGGPLIADILQAFPEVTKSAEELVLSPQSDLPFFEDKISELGFVMTRKTITFDEDKFYFAYRYEKGSRVERVTVEPQEVYLRWLEKEICENQSVLSKMPETGSERARLRRGEVEKEIWRLQNEINSLR